MPICDPYDILGKVDRTLFAKEKIHNRSKQYEANTVYAKNLIANVTEVFGMSKRTVNV